MCLGIRTRCMGKSHNPHGKRFRPLNKSEIEEYDKAARDSSDPLTELAARTPLYTGLRNGELSHIRGNWLTSADEGNYGVLRVPAEEECIGGAGTVGRSSSVDVNSGERGAACYTCRNTRGGHWEPRTKAAIRNIPIVEEGVYELLEDWFKIHEQIPLLHDAVGTRVQHVADRADLSRQVKPHDLRHTYGTILVRREVGWRTIATLMGHNPSGVLGSPPFREILKELDDSRGNEGTHESVNN